MGPLVPISLPQMLFLENGTDGSGWNWNSHTETAQHFPDWSEILICEVMVYTVRTISTVVLFTVMSGCLMIEVWVVQNLEASRPIIAI